MEISMRRAQPKKTDCSIIAVDKFIQATRDSGYKGTASAISELVDNAIQARARGEVGRSRLCLEWLADRLVVHFPLAA
jgi:hypothetical protein